MEVEIPYSDKVSWFAASVAAIIVFAAGIRYYPSRNIQYLQALDPYNLFRMSQEIAYTGGRPAVDFIRYFPYPTPSYTTNLGNLVVPAYLYRFGGFLFFDSYLQYSYAVVPAFAGISTAGLYFLGKELFDRYTGLGAAFFFAAMPGALTRTTAGFFEKEPFGTAFMVLSLLFFTRAWKKESWINGGLSGLFLGLFTVTWGGSQMMWLLYPMIAAVALLFDTDTRKILVAYTPTVLIGGGFGATMNSGRFWFTDTLFLASILGVLGIWMTYTVKQRGLVERTELFVPGIYSLGALLAVTSPLYSQTVAQMVLGAWRTATQTGSGIIGATVAENANASMFQLISQLGAYGAGSNALTNFLAQPASAWNFVFLSVPLITAVAGISLARGLLDLEYTPRELFSAAALAVVSWALGFALFFNSRPVLGIFIYLAGSAAAVYTAARIEGEQLLNPSAALLGVSAVFATLAGLSSPGILFGIAFPLWIAAAAVGIAMATETFPNLEARKGLILLIPLAWILSNVLGATARSRLIFLSTFAAALGAGYTFSVLVRGLRSLDLEGLGVERSVPDMALPVLVVALVFAVNAAAGFSVASGTSGKPNSAWMQGMDYLADETEPGQTVLSWWDYGYHFQSLGRSASVADGGNFAYYSEDGPVNYPLADYLTSPGTENHSRFLNKHSADYIMLDYTMVGKYQAVSQIARKDNTNFYTMRRAWSNVNPEELSGNETTLFFTGRGSQYLNVPTSPDPELRPLDTEDLQAAQLRVTFDSDLSVKEAPVLRYLGGGEEKINCVLTDNGTRRFGNSSEASDYCLAFDPYFSRESAALTGRIGAVLVPSDIKDHTLVDLYLQDGHGIPYAEKVSEASNGFLKTWKIERPIE